MCVCVTTANEYTYKTSQKYSQQHTNTHQIHTFFVAFYLLFLALGFFALCERDILVYSGTYKGICHIKDRRHFLIIFDREEGPENIFRIRETRQEKHVRSWRHKHHSKIFVRTMAFREDIFRVHTYILRGCAISRAICFSTP